MCQCRFIPEKNIYLSGRDADNEGKAVLVWGQGHRMSLHLLLKFTGNLKLLLKISTYLVDSVFKKRMFQRSFAQQCEYTSHY